MDIWTPDVMVERERYLNLLREAEQRRLIKIAMQGRPSLAQASFERVMQALKQAMCVLPPVRDMRVCALAGVR